METVEAAAKAGEALNSKEMDGREIEVCPWLYVHLFLCFCVRIIFASFCYDVITSGE